MTKVFVYTKLAEEKFFNFISGKVESEKVEYPEVFKSRYAGEVLERFEEMQLRDNEDVWEEFLISTVYGVLNRIEFNTEQLDEFSIKLNGLENQTNLEKFISNLYDLLSNRNRNEAFNDSLLKKSNINQEFLTFEIKQKMLTYINPLVIGQNSYSDKSYIEEQLHSKNFYRRIDALAYFLQSFTEEEFNLLDREEKQLFVTLAAIAQGTLKLKKSEFIDNFYFKLFSKSVSYCKKEINKIKEKETLSDVATILGFDNEYDFIAFHTNVTLLKTFKYWSEPAIDRAGEFIDKTLGNLKNSIYSEEMNILYLFIVKKLNGEDDSYRTRIKINLSNYNFTHQLETKDYNEENLKDLVIFALLNKTSRSNNSSITISMDGLKKNTVISILKRLKDFDEEEKRKIDLYNFLLLFSKSSDETEEDYLFSVKIFNEFYSLNPEKFINEFNRQNYLTNGVFKFFIESKFEVPGYSLSDLSVLRKLNQDTMIQSISKLNNVIDLFNNDNDLEEEEKIVLSYELRPENVIKNKNNDVSIIEKYIHCLFEYSSLSQSLIDTAISVYDSLILHRDEESFNELKEHLLDFIKSVYKDNTVVYYKKNQLKQYFIENVEEAINYIDTKIHFFDYYNYDEKALADTMFSLKKVKEFISEPTVKSMLHKRLAKDIDSNMSTEHFDLLFEKVIKTVNDFVPIDEESMDLINKSIKNRINRILPIFSNPNLMNFISENK